jgi:hypothetical protein
MEEWYEKDPSVRVVPVCVALFEADGRFSGNAPYLLEDGSRYRISQWQQ